MSEAKVLNSGAVTTLADNDLVVACDSSGTLRPIALGNLLALIRGDLQVGGRNLALNSGSYDNKANDGSYNNLGVYTSNVPWNHPQLSLSNNWEVGETYTLSYYFKGGSHYIFPMNIVCDKSNSSEWRKNVVTFKIETAFSADYIKKLQVLKGMNQDGSNNLSICGIKLERGNVATDWTPAPEDLGWGG